MENQLSISQSHLKILISQSKFSGTFIYQKFEITSQTSDISKLIFDNISEYGYLKVQSLFPKKKIF